MRIAISADWQFDEGVSLSAVNADGLYSRLADQAACFRWFLAQAEARRCKHIIVAGDLFESRTELSVMVLDVVGRLIQSAAKMFPEGVVLLAGNHDAHLRCATMTALHALASSDVTVVADEPLHYPPVGADLFLLPWNDDPEWTRAALIRCLPITARARFLIGHAMLEGLYPKPGGVPLDYFQPDRWTQVLLGDIHDPLLIDGHDNVRYIGAPMQHNFGDAGGMRGFYILETDDGDLQYIENDVSPRFHIVGHDGDLADIRPTDYVRVTDPALTQDARGRTERVEVRGVADDARTVHVRLNSTGRGEEVLRSYCEIKGVTGGDQERLVALGLELLEEGGNQ